jgi:putative MATE family efflux protein
VSNATFNLRFKQILVTAIPHMLLMMSQSLISIVDMLIVGNIGVTAIAAVGLCGFIFAVLTSGVTGIMISVQSVVGKKIGEGKPQSTVNALHGALLVAIVVGSVITCSLFFIPWFIYLLIDDPLLASNSIEYLQALVLAAPAIGVVRAFRGYFAGIGKNRFSLMVILSIYTANILISYSLVSLGFGIKGAGLGTAISFYIGVLLFLACGFLVDKQYRFFKRVSITVHFKEIAKLSFYAGFQQLFFSAGFAVMFIIASQIGAQSLAIVTVLNNLMLFSVMPLIGLGLASATFVSHSLGAKQNGEAKKWGNTALAVGLTLCALQLLILLIPQQVLTLFLKDSALVEKVLGLFQLTVIFIFFEAFAQILKFAMFGAGYNRRIARVTIALQWLLFIPGVYYLCIVKNQHIDVLWFCFLAYRAIEALLIALMWQGEKWFFDSTKQADIAK